MKRYKDIVGDGGSNIVGQVEEQHALLKARMATIRHKIAVVSGKGGVGKSSITANLAAAFAAQGHRVGVMDADINGPSIAKMLGVRGQKLNVTKEGVVPAITSQGILAMSMDLLLPSDATPVTWERIGTINATSAGAAGVPPGPAAPRRTPAPDPGGPVRGGRKASVGIVIARGPRVILHGRGLPVKCAPNVRATKCAPSSVKCASS